MTKDLLPKSQKAFAERNYWDEFFSKRGSQAFEWYGEYPQLCTILHKYIRFTDRLLVLGCGNSSLSADLYDAGYHHNRNVDISDVVVRQMTKKYVAGRPGLDFQKMDAEKLTFEEGEFNVVLDKGTLDALMPDEDDSTLRKVSSVLEEVGRVLRLGGRYLCVSLLQEHILRKILTWCSEQGWMLRIHRCRDAEEKSRSQNQSASFPVFVVVCTKMKKMPGMKSVLEYVDTDGEASLPSRLGDGIKLCETVRSVQQYALVRHNLNTRKWAGKELSVDFYVSEQSTFPRYRVFVVDTTERSSLKFAVFIVPQGRETDWIFATEVGRKDLASSAKSERLLVVHLDRNHTYESLERVKSELSQRVMDFAPPRHDPRNQVPFLSVGEDVGEREILHRGHSQMTGEYVVEDIRGEGDVLFRRLIFLSNPNVIQSEARLKRVKKKKRIDATYLACQHHKSMILGLSFLPPQESVRLLLVGLGGGGLPSYICHHLPKVHVDVVEIDAEIATIATKWFDLNVSNERISIVVGDGLDFIHDSASRGGHYHVVMLDVDNKDATRGLSVPPPSFLEKELLLDIQKIVAPSGLLILNLVCRDANLKNQILSRIGEVFRHTCGTKIPEEVNEVIYASQVDLKPTGTDLQLKEFRSDEVRIQEWLSSLEIH